jgi:hypothetical protein
MHSLLWIDVNGLKSPDSGTVQVPSCNIGSGAVAKLPQVAAFKIEGSRAIEGRTLEQAQSQGRRQWSVYRVKVEIDVS